MLLHLSGLNDAQARAVQHPPTIPLQILAGPGSGKTRVLISRIVHLIAVHGVPPSAICAVTFTNKAANEMRERLTKMLGKEVVALIKMGTFHSLCARYIRKYAALVGAAGNFTVCDADESKKIITRLLKPHKKALAASGIVIAESTVQSQISKAKANGRSSQSLLDKWTEAEKSKHAQEKAPDAETDHKLVIDQIIAKVYLQYQQTLQENNSLDFDDLLIYGVRLFKENRNVAKWCQHILVDEFQDTNTIQYELMQYIASYNGCLTVVGDPDQSIYGWRSAEVENIAKMKRDFSATEQILLEQNYRSTGSILVASVKIISQDEARIKKTLFTTHASGPKPTIRAFKTSESEACSIATEIKRIMACGGGMLGHNDFAILLRYNALSRVFESALQKEGIPCRILGGQRFFERLEIKDILAYLHLLDNPKFIPAFVRVINVPGRNIGEKSVAEILSTAARRNISPLALLERIHDGTIPDIKPPLKRKVGQLVKSIRTLRKLAKDCETPAALIRELLSAIQYEEHLKKTQQDWESRWENVQELINFAKEMERDLQTFIANASATEETSEDNDWGDVVDDDYDDEELDELGFAEIKQSLSKVATEDMTPLRAFLQMSMLSSDTEAEKEVKENEEEKQKKGRVTISTCHAAKGLEWAVVFVPAVEDGVFPAARSDDEEEERRLLYVACTRAQCLLYLTHAASRMSYGSTRECNLSPFLKCISTGPESVLSTEQPTIDSTTRSLFAMILERPIAAEEEVARRLTELQRTGKSFEWSLAYSIDPDDLPHEEATVAPQFCLPGLENGFSERHLLPTFVSAKSTVINRPEATYASSSHAAHVPMLPPQVVPNVPRAAVSRHIDFFKPMTVTSREHDQNKLKSSPKKKQTSTPPGFVNTLKHMLVEDDDDVMIIPKPLVRKPASTSSAQSTAPQTIGDPSTPMPQQQRPAAVASPAVLTTCSAVLSTNPTMNQSGDLVPKQGGGGKRRLGMGRAVVAYPSKKFKAPST